MDNEKTISYQNKIRKFTEEGYYIVSQTETSVQLKKRRKFNLGWFAFWTIITIGWGILIYPAYFLIMLIARKDQLEYITIDQCDVVDQYSVIEKL